MFSVGPSGLSVVAAMRTLVLEPAAKGVFRAAVCRPSEIGRRRRDGRNGLVNEPRDECGRGKPERSCEGAKPCGVFQRTAGCQRVRFRIVLVHLLEARSAERMQTATLLPTNGIVRLLMRTISRCLFLHNVRPKSSCLIAVAPNAPFGIAGRLTRGSLPNPPDCGKGEMRVDATSHFRLFLIRNFVAIEASI